jgi:hypothetical protein
VLVSFGLPGPLSFYGRARDMVLADRGQTSTEKASGSGRQTRLTLHLSGNAMPAKTTPKKPKRKKSKTSPTPAYPASAISTATQNLINMVAVSAVSGAVLLGLLAGKHF